MQYTDFPTAYSYYLPKSGVIAFLTYSDRSLLSTILLETHAAIAKILYATGMGENIDNILQERQRIHCFAPE